MERIGKVLHVSSSKNIVLKAETHAQIGDKVVDENLRQIGRIFDIFGPVSAPYVSVKTDEENLHSFAGRTLYVVPSKNTKRVKGRKR